MIKALARGLAGFALLAAGLAFVTAVSLLLLGSFIATWPIMRRSPRDRKVRAMVDLASSVMVALSAFADNDVTDA